MKSLMSQIELLRVEVDQSFEAVEYTDKSLIFQFPQIKLSIRSLVSAQCILFLDRDFQFPMTGKIVDCIANEDNSLWRVQIELHQYDKELWRDFLHLSAKEQKRVDQLIKEIKGDLP